MRLKAALLYWTSLTKVAMKISMAVFVFRLFSLDAHRMGAQHPCHWS